MHRKTLRIIVVCSLLASCARAQDTSATPVTITVSDATGALVPHARIRVVPAPDVPAKMETVDRGTLTLKLKPEGYAAFVQSAGFKTSGTRIDVGPTKNPQPIPIVLQPKSNRAVPPPSKDQLALLTYPYYAPKVLSASDLARLPHITATIHNSYTDTDETYFGVRLKDLLAPTGIPFGNDLRGEALAHFVVATGSDGYEIVLALAEVDPSFHSGEVLVADAMNGKPLDAHSGPFKLVVTEDKRPARAVRNLVTIELRWAE
jgi:hypothetical protein